MTIQNQDWIEGNLYFDFSKADYSVNFDKSGKGHGLQQILSSVDFIVEDEKICYFIEVKNPESRHIPENLRIEKIEKFKEELQTEVLKKKLLEKFFDSISFQSLYKGFPSKKLVYAIIICISNLTEAEMLGLKTAIEKKIRGISWSNPFDILVFNIESWNRHSIFKIERSNK